MPTDARKAFDNNCEDIRRLLDIHANVGGDAKGRRWGLEVLNKSGIILICSFWEAYCEDLAAEGLDHLVTHASNPEQLPMLLRKLVAKELREHDHELAPWSLAGDGWRTVLKDRLADLQAERNRKLNTPKSANVDELFKDALGIEHISRTWNWQGTTPVNARQRLDDFVGLRGDIAHRGKAAASVKKKDVEGFLNHVSRLVSKTGGRVNGVVRAATGLPLF